MSNITVPRVTEITGKKPVEDVAAERDWLANRKRFYNDTAKYGYGTKAATDAWKRRTQNTRTA
jgi:hypothetical protein